MSIQKIAQDLQLRALGNASGHNDHDAGLILSQLHACGFTIVADSTKAAQRDPAGEPVATGIYGYRYQQTPEQHVAAIQAQMIAAATQLMASQPPATSERAAVLEEAAQVCDAMERSSPRKQYQDAARWLASRIRTLATRSPRLPNDMQEPK